MRKRIGQGNTGTKDIKEGRGEWKSPGARNTQKLPRATTTPSHPHPSSYYSPSNSKICVSPAS